MDSATSGSLQSSSGGGDEELDSRPDALSAFFHGPPLAHPFDSLSHYLSPPSPLLPFSASSAPAPAPAPANPSPARPFLSSAASSSASAAAAASGATAPAPGQQRSSRKRTRASRRAPTTVLTTDTSNFRAMVQEFTGIPSPPFAAAAAAAAAATSFQYRSSARFGGHLLSGGASSSSAAAAADPAALQQQPPYLLRPFAQKLQAFPPLSSPSCPTPTNTTHSPTATTTTTTNTTTTTATTTTTTTNTIPITTTLTTTATTSSSSNNLITTPTNTNYQLPSPYHSLRNTQNPILSFQSLLQSQPPSSYAVPSMLTFSSRAPHLTASSTQYGSGDVGLPPGLIGPDELPRWAGGNQSRPAGPNYAAGSAPQQRGSSSCKVNYSSAAGSSAPDQFNAEESSAPENAAAGTRARISTTTTTTTRGEGTVDSWICSSRHRDH